MFPLSGDLYYDPERLMAGEKVPARRPVSPAPYALENRLLMREVYEWCPELAGRFLPFVSADPGRAVAKQVAGLAELAAEYPVYGIKINPVDCQSRADELLGRGAPVLDFAEARGLPLLFHVTTLPGEDYSQAADVFRIIEARPRLRFCLAHCLIFHRAFLERADAAPNVWVDTAALKIQVDLVRGAMDAGLARSQLVEADYDDYRQVMRTLCERFPKTMLWGSDSPAYAYICRRKQGEGQYEEFNYKGTYMDEVAALNSLGPKLRAQVCNTNTLAFLFGP